MNTGTKPDYLKIVEDAKNKDYEFCDGNCFKNYNPHVDHHSTCLGQIRADKQDLKEREIDKRTIAALFTLPLKQTLAFKYVLKYLQTGYAKGESLVLSGKTGRGKTIAASYVIKKNKEGFSVHADDLPSRFANNDDFFRLKHTKFLIIDDLGLEYRKDWFKSKFDALIHHRHSNFLPTVITTNLSGKEFTGTYSERIISRLREWGGFMHVVDMNHRKTRGEA